MNEPKAFEQSVSLLLNLAGYEVSNESIVGHKKVDLYLEERRLGSVRRVAVECKHYSKVLTKDELIHIYADYLPLYTANLIDEILVVTREGLAPGAQTVVHETREISHITYTELQSMVMDFRPYLTGLINQYEEDGLSDYYVPLRTTEGADLETEVTLWHFSSDHDLQPLAILASYGMGKTTFARRLSYVLAKNAINDSSQRTPILLRLADISSEQSLEGLLGKALTATSIVRNYSFDAFMSLNWAGRFVVLLDGFDEMKHTLTWDEFRFNFREINRLVNGNSRVILLGRPTAFLTEEEQRYALHGLQVVRGHTLRDPDWPDYREIHIAPFSREQVDQFLHEYFNYKLIKAGSAKDRSKIQGIIHTQIPRISGKQLSDIARRPVQLKMLAEVLPQWDGDVNELTVALLYSIFIDQIIRRELEKKTRHKFGLRERRQFASHIAWWLWSSKREMSFTAEDIPEDILTIYCQNKERMDAVRRDLVSACFLEKKAGGGLYFPHRSFQEFLVAEYIIDLLEGQTLSFGQADSIITEEIAAFMTGLVNTDTFKQWENNLKEYHGTLSWNFAQIWLSDVAYKDYLVERLERTEIPWYALLLTVAVNKALYPNFHATDLSKILLGKIKNAPHGPYALLCFLCLIGLWNMLESESRSANKISAEALTALCRPDHYYSVGFILSKINLHRKKGYADLSGFYTMLYEKLSGYCLLSGWVAGKTIRTSDISLPTRINLDDSQCHIIETCRSGAR